MVLNQIGTVVVTTARPIVFDRYTRQPRDRQLHPDRSRHPLHVRRRHDHASRCASRRPPRTRRPLSFAERLAHLARRAASDEEAAEAVRKALEEMLT